MQVRAPHRLAADKLALASAQRLILILKKPQAALPRTSRRHMVCFATTRGRTDDVPSDGVRNVRQGRNSNWRGRYADRFAGVKACPWRDGFRCPQKSYGVGIEMTTSSVRANATATPGTGVDKQSHTMTIGDAKRIFTDYGCDLHDFYAVVHDNLIGDRRRVELDNSNYLHALQLTAVMMHNTVNNFLMLSGSTTDNFLGTLSQSFERMLARIRDARGRVHIITLNPPDTMPTLDRLADRFPKTLQIVRGYAGDEARVGHFIVADNDVRVEEPHAILSNDTDANLVRAKVHFNDAGRANRYQRQFDALWQMLLR